MIHVMASIVVKPEPAAAAETSAAAPAPAMPMLASPPAVHGFEKIG